MNEKGRKKVKARKLPAVKAQGGELHYTPRDAAAGRRMVRQGWRLTEEERDRIHARAAARGLTLTAYLRGLVALDARGMVQWSAKSAD